MTFTDSTYPVQKVLVDADVLLHEVGSIGEDEEGVRPFDYVAEILDKRIAEIQRATEAEEVVLYITGKGNFREEVAVTKPYKGNRNHEKPYHYHNLKAYMKAQYDLRVAEGMEADDLLGIDQVRLNAEGVTTCIATRDKDLRMIPGWHYGWECGKQREFRKQYVDTEGWLSLDTEGSTPKLTGVGLSFFYAQLLMGDSVDNIPGCPGVGPKTAYELLQDVPLNAMMEVVQEKYEDKDCSEEYLKEQAQLLWICQEMDEDGSPVIWEESR